MEKYTGRSGPTNLSSPLHKAKKEMIACKRRRYLNFIFSGN
jgi:hypothetical protein